MGQLILAAIYNTLNFDDTLVKNPFFYFLLYMVWIPYQLAMYLFFILAQQNPYTFKYMHLRLGTVM